MRILPKTILLRGSALGVGGEFFSTMVAARTAKLVVVGNNPPRKGHKGPPKPPRKLQKAGQNLWDKIHSEYLITDFGSVEILTLAAQALDRAEALRAQIEQDGAVIATRQGDIKEHSALKSELANRAFVSRSLFRLAASCQPASRQPSRPIGHPPRGGLGITEPSPLDDEEED